MNRNFLRKTLLFIVSVLFVTTPQAQTKTLEPQQLDFNFSSDIVLPNFGDKVLQKDGYTFTFSGLKAFDANRSKTINTIPYKGACRTKQLDVSGFSSIGELSFAIQNGSGKSDGYVLTYVSDGGSAWTLADSLFIPKGKALQYSPLSVITKSAAKLRLYFSDGPTFWLYGVKARPHKHALLADSAAAFLSVNPIAGSYLPVNGVVSLQFDELMKPATGVVSLGNAIIQSVNCKGNLVEVTYSGFTDATKPLEVAANAFIDYSGKPLVSKISKAYAIDFTAPKFLSSSIVEGSQIHINDLGEDARKIKLIFDENIKLANAAITFANAKLETSVNANVLTLSYAGLSYNAKVSLNIPASCITDYSDNPLEADLRFQFNTTQRDNIAPSLIKQSVASAAENQEIGGNIFFEFDEIVKPGNVRAKINGEDVCLSNNGKYIGLNYTNLPYNAVIAVELPEACIVDTCGNPFAGTTFKFSTKQQLSRLFDIVVDKAGKGNFTSIQAAINSVADSTKRTLIYVRKGVYQEKIVIPRGKNNISLIGEHVDNTIITWNECSSTATPSPGTDNSYSMQVAANNFYAENLTIRNDYDFTHRLDANKQAVALMNRGDKQVFKNCKFISYQDTHYLKDANKRQYFANCEIQGNVDFIFGSATSFFESCTIKCVDRASYITAAATTPQEFGFVFKNTTIEPALAKFNNKFYLGRPWGADCKTVFINTKVHPDLIQPAGWAEWNGNDNHKSAFYAEYNTVDLNDSAINLANRVSWSKQLSAFEAARYNHDNVFNFGADGSWNPLSWLTSPITPSSPSLSWTGEFTWQAVCYSAGYLVYRNDTLLASVASPIYKVDKVNPTDLYSVAAYNEYGALSTRSACALAGIEHLVAKMDVLQKTIVEDELLLKNPDFYATIEIVNMKGQKLIHKEIHGVSVYVGNLPKGTYYARACTKLNECRVETFVKK